MVSPRAPPALGLVAAVGVVALAVAPVVADPGVEVVVLRTYLGFGPGGYWLAVGLAAVLIVVFAAGATGRTHPATAAGIALGAGVVLALVVVLWAASVDVTVATDVATRRWVWYHRLVAVAVAGVVPAAAAWWAVSLGLVGSRRP
ncbi:MAG: hypothetical protein ACLFM8_00775 [Halobacteriales archaeon]